MFDIGIQPTVRDLIFWMIVQTDNLATDLMLEKVGAANVRARLRSLGLDEFSVDRNSRDLILQYYGTAELIPKKLTREEYRTVTATFPKIARERLAIARVHGPIPEAVQVYLRDPRDTGSPLHLNMFLVKMFRGELVSPAASRQMLEIMLETRTGRAGWAAGAKLVGLLPAGTPVAHKTGDWPTANSDVGIIFLPDDRGHVAISVLTTNMNEDPAVSGHMIARIARAVYDFFVAEP
jgi:beta-lactamase class A